MNTPSELPCAAAGGGGTEHEANLAESALVQAARGGDLAIIQRLLREGGSSIEEKDSNGSNCLAVCCL